MNMVFENTVAVVGVTIALVCQLLGIIHLPMWVSIFFISWLGFGGILWLTAKP